MNESSNKLQDENKVLTSTNEWLKYNTYSCLDYDNLFDLYCSKNKRTISLVMPALNEESTVGHIIETIFLNLNKDFQLLDEFILIDGGSTDQTINIVEGLAKKHSLLKVVHEKDILSYVKSKKGKGNQLWKGLYCSKSDIVLYCDSDLKNFDVRMIYGMIGPLLKENIKFVKGFYERPLVINENVKKSNEGGRVTELCARPMLNLFYPELAGFIQPLGGEYGGYRDVLENVHYMTGYGVEVNILIELYEKYGLDIMGQVDLLKREHRHQNTNALTKMSFIIMNTILKRHIDKPLNAHLLMKNFTQDSDENFKNNVIGDEVIHDQFLLIKNSHDEVLPTIKSIKTLGYDKLYIND
jgi:glucosyl-3-phosphoglycerate synthase